MIWLTVTSALALINASPLACSDNEKHIPSVLAPEVISNTGHQIFRGVLDPSNKEFYFFRALEGEENYGIYYSRKNTSGNWTTPERLVLDDLHSDFYPAISNDSKTMVFSSYRPTPDTKSGQHNANFWITYKQGEKWSSPKFLKNISQPGHYNNRPFFRSDGRLGYASTSPDWQTTHEYTAIPNSDIFGSAVLDNDREQFRVWAQEHEKYYLWNSVLSPDGLTAIIEVSSRNDEGRPGPADLWFSIKKDEQWTEPKPFGSTINTDSGNENFPTFSADGKTMVFVRDFKDFYTVSLSCAISEANK